MSYPSLIVRLSFAHCSLIVCRWEDRESWEGWGERGVNQKKMLIFFLPISFIFSTFAENFSVRL